MTNYIALNIGLLLPSTLEEVCINLNTEADADPFSDFRKDNNNPHITLAMGVFEERNIDVVIAAVRTVVEQYDPIETTITRMYRKESEQIGQEYQLEIKRTNELVKFHRSVMEAVKPYFCSIPATKEMFVVDPDETWEPNTTYWIDGFKEKKPADYKPHISLKCREVTTKIAVPIDFIADTIVVARVGNYCSSRNVIEKIEL
jgi:hypothetical protein